MSGIRNGVVRFIDFRNGRIAIETDADSYTVYAIASGEAEQGDQVVGNLDREGAVDLFNQTRRDHLKGTVLHVLLAREAAIREMQHFAE